MEDAATLLDWVHEYWPDFVDARMPLASYGPRNPPPAPAGVTIDFPSVHVVTKSPWTLGETAAPLNVPAYSALLESLVLLDALTKQLARARYAPPPCPLRPGDYDARPLVAYARARAREDLWDAQWVEPYAQQVHDTMCLHLGMTYDGQRLDVVCPWCRTPDAWHVKTAPGGETMIVCAGVCEPPLREVGTWWGGHPCWPISDWPRLAKHATRALSTT